ncbi:hypothetical protein FS594_28840 (plasmid) [Rahnella aquatilis]|nr:hypothetical protein FS594_28840 [Rahnella aquatilis]
MSPDYLFSPPKLRKIFGVFAFTGLPNRSQPRFLPPFGVASQNKTLSIPEAARQRYSQRPA